MWYLFLMIAKWICMLRISQPFIFYEKWSVENGREKERGTDGAD